MVESVGLKTSAGCLDRAADGSGAGSRELFDDCGGQHCEVWNGVQLEEEDGEKRRLGLKIQAALRGRYLQISRLYCLHDTSKKLSTSATTGQWRLLHLYKLL